MEQLEIKHLGRRLAYGVKVSKTHTLNYGSGIGGLSHILTTKSKNYKPILRDLSCLTKEITHKGKKFIPSEIIWQRNPNHIKLASYFVDTNQIMALSYSHIEMLLSWHFVLDEPEGTWIDVNTLPKNPYE